TEPLPTSPWAQQPGPPQPQPVVWSPGVPATDEFYYGAPEPPRRRRRRTPLILATVTVLTLAAAGAAYAGFRLWYGSGSQPEEATPESVTAFVRLDLAPGIGQGRKLENLIKKFPSTMSTDERLADIEKSLLKSLDFEDVDFATDIRPWFGDR